MREKLKALYQLQQIDLELAKAQKMMASLDDGVASRQQLETARQASEGAQKSFHEAASEQRDKELNVKTIESKCKLLKDKMFSGKVTSSKELSNIEKEIEMLGRQKDKLEERIMELYDLVEERKTTAGTAQSALTTCQEALDAYMTKLKKNTGILAARIKDATARREAAVAAVDPLLLKRYEAMKARGAGVVVSKVEDGDCSACHTQLVPGTMHALKDDVAIQTCENCGRMLYLEKE